MYNIPRKWIPQCRRWFELCSASTETANTKIPGSLHERTTRPARFGDELAGCSWARLGCMWGMECSILSLCRTDHSLYHVHVSTVVCLVIRFSFPAGPRLARKLLQEE